MNCCKEGFFLSFHSFPGIYFFFKNHSKPVRLLSSYGLFLQTINEKFQIFRPVTELNNYNLDLHLRILGFFKEIFQYSNFNLCSI